MKKIITLFFSITAVMFVMALYIFTLRGVAGNPVTSDIKNNLDQATKPLELSPERGRYALIMALVNTGRFDLGPGLADAVYPDVGWHQGRFYILFAPGISLMALPLYILGAKYGLAQVASFFLSSLFATGSAVVLFKISRYMFKLPVWASVFSSVAFSFGSISWAYAVTLYQHQATTFFILSGIYAVWKYAQKSGFSWLYSLYVWLAYALAISVDYPNIALMAPVIVYLGLTSFSLDQTVRNIKLSFRPVVVATSAIFIAITLLHGYYNKTQFGGWTKISGGLIDYKTIKESNLLASASGDLVIKSIEKKINPTKFFTEQKFPFGFYTLTVSDDRGLVLYSPLFVLGLLGILARLRRLELFSSVMIANVMVVVFLYSSWGDPWGGWAYGPRYLIPVFGLLSPFVAAWISDGKFLKKLLALVLFIYSSAVALLGALTTNTIPPTPEAIYLHTQYNFVKNIPFIAANRSSSFMYNTFINNYMNLTNYFLIILGVVVVLAILILFVVPLFTKHDH